MAPRREINKRLKPLSTLGDTQLSESAIMVQPIIIMIITIVVMGITIFFIFRTRPPFGHHGVLVRNGRTLSMKPLDSYIIRTPLWDRLECFPKNSTCFREKFTMTLVDDTEVGLSVIIELKFLRAHDLDHLVDQLGGRASNLKTLVVDTTIHKVQTGRLSKMDACMFHYMQAQNFKLEIIDALKAEVEAIGIQDYIQILGIHVVDVDKIERIILTTCGINEPVNVTSTAIVSTPPMSRSSTQILMEADLDIETTSLISSLTQVTRESGDIPRISSMENSRSDPITVHSQDKAIGSESKNEIEWDEIFCK